MPHVFCACLRRRRNNFCLQMKFVHLISVTSSRTVGRRYHGFRNHRRLLAGKSVPELRRQAPAASCDQQCVHRQCMHVSMHPSFTDSSMRLARSLLGFVFVCLSVGWLVGWLVDLTSECSLTLPGLCCAAPTVHYEDADSCFKSLEVYAFYQPDSTTVPDKGTVIQFIEKRGARCVFLVGWP